MKIGIVGDGHIGKTLVRKLSSAGHEVKVANSRGPDTIGADVLASGGHAVSAAEALVDVDGVILSILLNRLPEVAPLMASVPAGSVVIDTSNYYPHRDGTIDALEAGQVESVWVAEQLGRPVVKAWNSIGSDSFARKGKPAGSPDRIALSVAADREADRKVGMKLRGRRVRRGYARGILAAAARRAVPLHGPHRRGDAGRAGVVRRGATAQAARSDGGGDAGTGRGRHNES